MCSQCPGRTCSRPRRWVSWLRRRRSPRDPRGIQPPTLVAPRRVMFRAEEPNGDQLLPGHRDRLVPGRDRARARSPASGTPCFCPTGSAGTTSSGPSRQTSRSTSPSSSHCTCATALALLVHFRHDWVRIVRGFFASLRKRRIDTPDERLAWLLVVAHDPGGDHGARARALPAHGVREATRPRPRS